LELTTLGFRLQRGVTAQLPDDVHSVWVTRVASALSELPAVAHGYLERAAVLGLGVSDAEWHSACDDATSRRGLSAHGVFVRASLVEALLSERLATETEQGWSFSHAMVRESMLRAAAEGGRLIAHHRACAEMLQARVDDGQWAAVERLGRHLLEAGELDAAVEFLFDGAEYRTHHVGLRPALSLYGVVEDALVLLGASQDDPRWARLAVKQARLMRQLGDHAAAEQAAQVVLDGGARPGWGRYRHKAMLVRVQLLASRRELDAAEATLDDLWRALDSRSDPALLGVWYNATAQVAEHRIDWEGAKALYLRAEECFASAGNAVRRTNAARSRAHVTNLLGERTEARETLEWALGEGKRLNSRSLIANCTNNLAEMAREDGRLDEAEQAYEQARALFSALGSPNSMVCAINLTLVRLRRGAYVSARRDAEVLIERAARMHWDHVVAACHLVTAACSAGIGNWEDFDQSLDAADRIFARFAFLESDTVWPLELAGDIAAASDHRERAVRALTGAAERVQSLGRHERAAAVRERLAAILQ
jgi:tetratricopeptide (TPR) repeat protein